VDEPSGSDGWLLAACSSPLLRSRPVDDDTELDRTDDTEHEPDRTDMILKGIDYPYSLEEAGRLITTLNDRMSKLESRVSDLESILLDLNEPLSSWASRRLDELTAEELESQAP
jgi:hypothetical protein